MIRENTPRIHTLLLIFLFGYIFVGDLLSVLFGFPFFKLIFAGGTAVCSMIYIFFYYKRLNQSFYLWMPLLFLVLYVFIFRSTSSISYFYTAIFAFLMVQHTEKTRRFIDVLFFVQFLLVLYEVMTQSMLYTNVSSGLFNVQDIEQNTNILDESGFRAKGMFTGILEASSFAIYYSLLNKDSYMKSFLSFLMTVLLNGRMAMIIACFIFLYNWYFWCRTKHIPKGFIKFIVACVICVGGIVLVNLSTSSLRVQHLLSVFDPNSPSLFGRIQGYTLAAEYYFNVYDLPNKLFGGEYQLIGLYGLESAAESDVLGMLLEIGLVGFLWILFNIIKAWRINGDAFFESRYISSKIILVCMIVCLIEYRFLAGNVRGTMFWFIILSMFKSSSYRTNNNN